MHRYFEKFEQWIDVKVSLIFAKAPSRQVQVLHRSKSCSLVYKEIEGQNFVCFLFKSMFSTQVIVEFSILPDMKENLAAVMCFQQKALCKFNTQYEIWMKISVYC